MTVLLNAALYLLHDMVDNLFGVYIMPYWHAYFSNDDLNLWSHYNPTSVIH